MSKKPIIVFEGIEGSGKSHHISKVAKYLDKKKINYLKLTIIIPVITRDAPKIVHKSIGFVSKAINPK